MDRVSELTGRLLGLAGDLAAPARREWVEAVRIGPGIPHSSRGPRPSPVRRFGHSVTDGCCRLVDTLSRNR